VLLWAAAIAHIVAGNVDFGLAGTILIGSVPGVWLGSHWSVRLPVGTLRLGLGIVLIGASLGLLSKAGAGIPPAVIAAAPVLLAFIVAYQQFSWRPRRARRIKAAVLVPAPPADE
jgi:uncharacterized protein